MPAFAPPVAVLRAGCKINLYLRVGNRLPNGYHELETLFVPLDEPHDTLEVFRGGGNTAGASPGEAQGRQGIRVEFSAPGIDPERNTLTKAYAWYAARTGFAPALAVRVKKGIPHGAGLGGGSADAAALLRYLQEEAPKAGCTPLAREELLEGSAAVGADVPFFLLDGAAKATGVGEKLVPVPNPCAGYFLVLVCPDAPVSTAWAFAALDERRDGAKTAGPAGGLFSRPDGEKGKFEKIHIHGLTSAGHQATYDFACAPPCNELGNDFEDLVFARLPELVRLRARLCEAGAELARMSGTGSSIFALFREESTAGATVKALASDGWTVYMQKL